MEQVSPYISRLFDDTFLPSHDHGHHFRVWNLCKYLLLKLESFSSIANMNQIEALFLATFFHDSGMTIDTGTLHGAYGKEIYERFLAECGMQKPALHDDILDLIASHDSKERSLYPDIVPGKAPGMMGILSMSDDLDALGAVGIYRYSEIYLKRGLAARELGIQVLGNVRMRFNNMRDSCEAFPGLWDPFLADYHLIEQFFNRYNQLLMCTGNPEEIQWGEPGVVNFIRALSLESKVRPEEFIFQSPIASSRGIVKSYFKKLHDELEFKSQ